MSVTAWTTTFPSNMTHIVFAQIGLQVKERKQSAEYFQMIQDSFQLRDGPIHVDLSFFIDSESYTNHLFMAYWDSPQKYRAWLAHPQVQRWWSGRLIDRNSETGFFKEVATIPLTHFETIHSRYNRDSGVTHFTSLEETKVHAYWGSMRDRLPASANDQLESDYDNERLSKKEKNTFGKRVKVAAPGNVCLIRTAQDWTHCNEEERKTYFDLVKPTLHKAHEFLSTHPEETGCISAKMIQEVDAGGEFLDKTCVVGFFLSLKHLEKWTHDHATHKAVFGTYLEMMQRHNFSLDLSLWHEVSVLQPEDLELEYVNCHPNTGFIPFFEMVEMDEPDRRMAAK